MKQKVEIERKFLIMQLPNLNGIRSTKYERFILFSKDEVEVRVQLKDNRYFLERKVRVSKYTRDTYKWEITRNEFELFKQLSIGGIIRESYTISDQPNISIKVYHYKYEGLIRIEVEFDSEEDAQKFSPPSWFGQEITGTDLASDSKLVKLTRQEMLERLV